MNKVLSVITCIASLISALVALYLLAERKGWLDRFCICDDDCWCEDEDDYLEFCDDCDCCEECEQEQIPTDAE
jgi:hypothetical protein